MAGPDRITAQTRTLQIPVTALDSNTIAVHITGPEGSALAVGIGPERPPTIAVSPATATLGASRTQQFGTVFTGTDNTSVRWYLERGPESGLEPFGAIDQSGLYTAPDTIDHAFTVRVIARREAATANTAAATIQLQPPVRVGEPQLRVPHPRAGSPLQ